MELIALGALGAALIAYAALGRSSHAARSRSRTPASLPPWRRDPAADPDPDPGGGGAEIAIHPEDPGAPAVESHDRPQDGSAFSLPRTSDWAALLAPGCVAWGIPLAYALRWVDMESGGNPCAIGYPPAHGPDGMPLELGIAQLYNPDDLHLTTPPLTGAELRAYCVPGDQHEIMYKGRVIRGFSQALLRPLLPEERTRQAQGAIDLIRASVRRAEGDLQGVGAGPGWARDGRDFWRLVKLQHGLPAFSREGMPAVARLLGRAPRGWKEFTASLGRVTLGHSAESRRGELAGSISNAERCAGVLPESTSSVA